MIFSNERKHTIKNQLRKFWGGQEFLKSANVLFKKHRSLLGLNNVTMLNCQSCSFPATSSLYVIHLFYSLSETDKMLFFTFSQTEMMLQDVL